MQVTCPGGSNSRWRLSIRCRAASGFKMGFSRPALPGVHQCTSVEGPTCVDVKVALEEEGAVGAVVQEIVNGGSRILSLKKVEPTLEDVFVELVGQGVDS